MSRILVAAGEVSGDQHAARLISAMRESLSELEVVGLGGEELVAAGMDQIADSSEISVVGITEVLKILGRAKEIFRLLLAEVDRRPPDLAILVDFPDFNLRLARQLHQRGIPVVYYISPQVWAWRKRRVHLIAECVQRILVLFAFEADWYRERGVSAVHVGHPLVDEVPELPQAWDGEESGTAGGPRRIALLPGSRRSEVRALLPTMLRSCRRLAQTESIEVRLIRAPSIDDGLLEGFCRAEVPDLPVEIVHEDRFRTIADSHLALCASGTATLEVGLLGTPMVVLYRLKPVSYWLARALVRLPAFSLVNLVLEENAVPELLQGEVNPGRISAEASHLLNDQTAREEQRTSLTRVRENLGARGASQRAAKEVLACLRQLA